MADDPRDPGNLTSSDPESPADALDASARPQVAVAAPGTADEGPVDPSSDPNPSGPEEPSGPTEPPPRPTFLGEIVQRRSWPLLAIVFLFGLFLAAVPFLFQAERSPFTDALSLYDRLCAARPTPVPADLSAAARAMPATRIAEDLAALPCVNRADFLPRMDPVEGRQFGTNRAFVVTLERRTGAPSSTEPAIVRYLVEEEEGRVRWAPWPANAPR